MPSSKHALLMLMSVGASGAFAPTPRRAMARSSLSFGLPPFSIADEALETPAAAAEAVQNVVTDVARAAVDAAPPSDTAVETAAAASNSGWFGFLTVPTMALLGLLHSGLVSAGLGGNAWGASIIMLTILIKALTFPLTKTQLESTNKMQALQPQVKEIQSKYQSNPEVMNQKMAALYQTNDVNPLAGCLPSLAQIPIFIGLYRAVLDLAKENRLDEGFLWIPSLEGPVYGADPSEATGWLFNWVDGVPALGWDDTISFLILPVFLVLSQFVSMELMQPKGQDAPQGNFILKLLPLMIGWFSLTVPSALTLYWVVNNIVTTATSVIVRNTMAPVEPVAAAASTATPSPSETFAPSPLREKPAGFSAPVVEEPDIKPITAEIVAKETMEQEDMQESVMDASASSGAKRGSKKKKTKKRKKN